MSMRTISTLGAVILGMSSMAWADENKPYLGEFVGSSLPGFGRILQSGVVVWEDASEFTEVDGPKRYLRASNSLTALCRQKGGIGIVNYRIDMELGRLSKNTDTSIEVTERAIKYLVYGDCVLSAVPLDSLPDKR